MKESVLSCEVEARRDAVRAAQNQHGLDYLEVSQNQQDLRVVFLGKAPEKLVLANVVIEGGQRISGIRVKNLRVYRLDDPDVDDYMVVTVDRPGDFSTYTICVVEADKQGLPVSRGDGQSKSKYVPLRGFDPRYACLDFNFKVSCPSDLDCASSASCPPPVRVEPEINYLAKDYSSFRQLILDRLALIMPDWQERHIPDLGIAVVEVLAYVGDYLSYYQDAVATEAYLDTARQRISVRRHARLVDYLMHEGCNARAWVCISTDTDWLLDPKLAYFISGLAGGDAHGRVITNETLRKLPLGTYEVFEVLRGPSEQKISKPIPLYVDHSEIHFYAWGDRNCCLPRGATSATLIGAWSAPPDLSAPKANVNAPPAQSNCGQNTRTNGGGSMPLPQCRLHLQAGDILIFEEILGPRTGIPADADPSHRHAVRLTSVTPSMDTLYNQPVVEIEWAADDALPFSLCISATSQSPTCAYLQNVSVARGNVVIVDHGRTIEEPPHPGMVLRKTAIVPCPSECQPAESSAIAERYRPELPAKPLTFSQPFAADRAASGALLQDPRQALPWILLDSIPPAPDFSAPLFQFDDLANPTAIARRLKNPVDTASQILRAFLSAEVRESLDSWDGIGVFRGDLGKSLVAEFALLIESWMPRIDLLQSGENDRNFVVEMDDDGWAHLRFGDGDLGQMPEAATAFRATYRVGNGPSGNVGAEAISYIVTDLAGGVDLRPRNPFPAQGGLAPESLAEVKLFAPGAFRKKLERAVTTDDYASIAARNPKLQRAGATLRWTGSWYEELVAIDPLGTEQTGTALRDEIATYLYPFRRMGHDLVVAPAKYVPLQVAINVCVLPHYLRGHVEAALLEVLGNRQLPDGRVGFFHPDSLSFGEGVDLSRLVAATQGVLGVQSVEVTEFHRLFEPPNHEIENGILPLGPFEIAQLDNDPDYPEHGTLKLTMRGGR